MAPKKEKDIVAPFIQGPSMDWTMDDGLYSCFQTWKISCNLILDSELCELSEVRKINTLLRWSGDFGIKKLKSWQREPSQLTLNFTWSEYKSYCKPQSNELHAQYDILKRLTQGSLPADDKTPITAPPLQLQTRDGGGVTQGPVPVWLTG